MRQGAVLAADDEHAAELQALGRVQAHQPHLVAAVVLVVARQQGQLRGQVAGAGAARAAFEPFGQLVQVGLAALERGFVPALAAQVGQQAGFFGQPPHQVGRAQLRGVCAQVGDGVVERAQAVGRARRQLLQGAHGLGRARHRQVLAGSQFGQPGQRSGADFTFGRLHRAQEGGVIVRVGQHPQPGQRVLDLLAFEEGGTAGEVVGHAQQLQGLLQWPRLVVAAEQDAELVPRHLRGLVLEEDLGGNLLGLVLAVAAFPHPDALAVGLVAPQGLGMLVRVACDQGIGRAQHPIGAAVVLLQLDHLQGRVVACHLLQVFRIGTAPGVDALVVVAHAGEVPARAGDGLEQPVLGVVGVLALVHQQVADAFAPGGHDLGVFLQHLHRQPDQVVEIDRVERGQPRLVAGIEPGRLHLAGGTRRGQRLFRRQAGVLGARDQVFRVLDGLGLGAGHQVLDLGGAVIGVEDGKAAAQADGGVLDLQELQAQGVEGADGQLAGRLALDPLANAFAHLLGRLVGEGDRGDALGRVAAAVDQVGDLFHDHPGLAAAGACQHQQWALVVQHRGALGGIEHVGGMAGRPCILPGRCGHPPGPSGPRPPCP